MADAGVEGPQACPKGLRHAYGLAAVAAGVPLPTIAAALGHANLQTTAVYTTAAGLEAYQAHTLDSRVISCDLFGHADWHASDFSGDGRVVQDRLQQR